MTNVIHFHEAKSQRQRDAVIKSFFDLFHYAVDLFIHYWFNPLVAAVTTAHRRRLVVL